MPPKLTAASPAFISRSEDLESDFLVYVDAPDPAQAPGPWPAVVFVDGDYTFDLAAVAARELAMEGAIPPVVVAAVGYGKPFGSPENRRGRDYTPTPAPEEPQSGGADGFLGHLTGRLWQELAGRHPLRDDHRVLAGHSLGGLFALHALFQPSPFFNRVLVGAPSLWWADRAFLAQVARFRKIHAALPAHLFLGIGAQDTESMSADLSLLERQLEDRPFEYLKVTQKVFPSRDHYNVVHELFREGLRALLGSRQKP